MGENNFREDRDFNTPMEFCYFYLMKKWSAFLVGLMIITFCHSQELANCEFTNGDTWNSSTNLNINASPSSPLGSAFNQEWVMFNLVTGPEINPFRYYSFRMTSENCSQFKIDSISWKGRCWQDNPADPYLEWHLRSSLDNFSSDMTSDTLTTTMNSFQWTPDLNAMDSLHVVEFRLYFTDSLLLSLTNESSNTIYLDEFRIFGNIFASDTITYFYDDDQDGYGDPSFSYTDCNFIFPYSVNSLDCDPGNPFISPATIWMLDQDQDGFYNYFDRVQSCESPGNSYVISEDYYRDCNDSAFSIHPDAFESACPDGMDADCDGFDQGTGLMPHCDFHLDEDGDGYGNGIINNLPCCSEYVANYLNQGYLFYDGLTDCNDQDSLIHPFAEEIPDNTIDENCDGSLMNLIEMTEWNIQIAQNPSSQLKFFKVPQLEGYSLNIALFDASGKCVLRQKYTDFSIHNESQFLPNGQYSIVIYNNEKKKSMWWIKI